MDNQKHTTVNLTDYAQPIKDRLKVYGLKNIISAGLVLLDMLEPKDREEFIGLISAGSKAEIEAFVDELCAAYASKSSKHKAGQKLVQRPAKAG